jgi:hypothetical protein
MFLTSDVTQVEIRLVGLPVGAAGSNEQSRMLENHQQRTSAAVRQQKIIERVGLTTISLG